MFRYSYGYHLQQKESPSLLKTQFRILMFMVCLNLSVGLIIGLALPGSEWVQASTPINASEYESHFNATEIAEGWESTPFSGIPIIGDIFSGFNFLWVNIQYLLDGFPMFLTWVSDTYLTDPEAKTAFGLIAWTLRGIYAVIMSVMAIEFITGRMFTE